MRDQIVDFDQTTPFVLRSGEREGSEHPDGYSGFFSRRFTRCSEVGLANPMRRIADPKG